MKGHSPYGPGQRSGPCAAESNWGPQRSLASTSTSHFVDRRAEAPGGAWQSTVTRQVAQGYPQPRGNASRPRGAQRAFPPPDPGMSRKNDGYCSLALTLCQARVKLPAVLGNSMRQALLWIPSSIWGCLDEVPKATGWKLVEPGLEPRQGGSRVQAVNHQMPASCWTGEDKTQVLITIAYLKPPFTGTYNGRCCAKCST